MTLSSIFEKETLAFSGRCQNAFGSLGHLPVCQNLLSSIEALSLPSGTTSYYHKSMRTVKN